MPPTRKPTRARQGTQSWRHLLFVHWPVPLAVLRPLVPEALSIDTYEGVAYVGLVPFEMHDVKPYRWAPMVPTARNFLETNVRTYVHMGGDNPGVWFLSLEAASSLAVWAARAFWHLPYFRAKMVAAYDGNVVDYQSTRQWPEPKDASLSLRYEIGTALPASEPETLRFFLAERYLLYSTNPRGELFRGQVHHAPYPLHEARIDSLHETLVARAGIASQGDPISALYSPGVDVDIFALERVG